jgi:hypothetical protein
MDPSSEAVENMNAYSYDVVEVISSRDARL